MDKEGFKDKLKPLTHVISLSPLRMSSYVCRLVSDKTKKACWLVTALREGLKEQETKGTKA